MDRLLVITALTMTLAPILSIINERLVLPRVGTKESEKRPMDHIAKMQKVILVGFGHFGSTVGRFLRANGVEATILDHDSNRVELLRKMGFEVYYGDATREDLLESAGAAEADILICAIDDPDTSLELVELVKRKFPQLHLMVRAKSRVDAYEFINRGIHHIYRESLEASVKLASDVLNQMGFRKYTIYRQAQNFIKYDEESLRRLAEEKLNTDEYIFKAREEIELQERLLEQDLQRGIVEEDHSWDSEQMRKSIEKASS
jgi:CPA2 family monovalent cation:H+ antiporter-2/glutathione-regulated potassium-efflux system protein KefB